MKKIIALLFLFLIHTGTSLAGAGYIITESGAPSEWDNSSAITVNPEDGACGTFTNAQMLSKLATNLGFWSGLSEVALDFTITDGSLGGVDGCNYGDFLVNVTGSDTTQAVNDGFHPLLFDNDGDIVAAVAGATNRFRVLGFANPAVFTSDYATILDGQGVFNCLCLPGNSFGPCSSGGSTIEFSEADLDFTMVHEMGHFLNLDHTQINADLIDDGDADNDDHLPTMYPVAENSSEQISPMQDDISSLGAIYPASGFSGSHCRVTGSLLDTSGNQLRCADVQAINSTDRSKSVAFVSGAYAPAVDNNGDGDTVDSGECTSNCGDFQLYLDPGISYTVGVTAINSSFTSGSGISPCANGQLTTINTETIATLTASQCTAGATISLGNITTTSTGGVTPSGSENVPFLNITEDTDYDTGAYDIQYDLPPMLLGGSSANTLRATDSCPESDGSSSGSSSSSSSSSSGLGCSFNEHSVTTPVLSLGILFLAMFALTGLRFVTRNQ